MVSIGVLQLSLWQRVHFWSPSRDRSACADAESEPKSTETPAQIRKSRISLRIFFLRVGNLESLLLTFRTEHSSNPRSALLRNGQATRAQSEHKVAWLN